MLNFEIVMNAINHRSKLQSLHLTQISKPPQLAPTLPYSHWNYLEFTSQECILSSFLQDQTQHNDRDWENYFVETIFSKYGQTCHRWWRRFKHFKSPFYLFSEFHKWWSSQHFAVWCQIYFWWPLFATYWSPGVSADQVPWRYNVLWPAITITNICQHLSWTLLEYSQPIIIYLPGSPR